MNADTCPTCSGWGYLLWAAFTPLGEAHDKEPCERCDGRGLIGGAA